MSVDKDDPTAAKIESPPWDAINKAAFNHAEVLRDFLRLYVDEAFVKELDLAKPEPLPAEFVTEAMRKRYNDYIRKIHWKGSDAYLLLVIEFQTKKDPWIPVRVLAYTALLWLDLIETGNVTIKTKLPPVFPIVLYSGSESWDGPLDIAHLLSPTALRVAKYQPTHESLLFREELIKNELLNENSDLYALFLLIRRAKKISDFRQLLSKYKSILNDPSRHELLKTFLSIMNTMQTYFNEGESNVKVGFSTLEEVEKMLQTYAEQFRENSIKEELPLWREDTIKTNIQTWKEDTIKTNAQKWKEETVKINAPIWIQEYKDNCKSEGILLSIKNFLEARFGDIYSNYELRLQSIKNIDNLQELSRDVYKVNSINEFEALLDKVCSKRES